jgi:fructosamine-3-kinase
MHAHIVETRLRRLRQTAFADLVPGVEAFFARNAPLIAGDLTPRLLHMDLHQGNVMIHAGQVSGILDVEESVIGHNEYDLMRTELANFRGAPPAFARAFHESYADHVLLDEGYAGRKAFYDVSRTLVWLESIVAFGDRYARGDATQDGAAARAHLRSLLHTG